MIKRGELIAAYWGDSGSPSEWRSIEEIAQEYSVTPDYIQKAMYGYGIPVRDLQQQAHKIIYEFLVNEYGLDPNEDFLYQTEVNRHPVDFWLVKDLVGIRVDKNIPSYQVDMLHIHNQMVLIVGCEDPGKMLDLLRRELKSFNIKGKRGSKQTEEDGEGW